MERLDAVLRNSLRGDLKSVGDIAVPWEEVVGPAVANHCRPRRLANGTLFLQTSSPAWAQQLTFLAPRLIKRLNRFLGRQAVRQIRFEGGGFHPGDEKGRARPRSLTAHELAVVEEISVPIAEPRLKEAFGRVLAKDLARKDAEGKSVL